MYNFSVSRKFKLIIDLTLFVSRMQIHFTILFEPVKFQIQIIYQNIQSEINKCGHKLPTRLQFTTNLAQNGFSVFYC